MSEIEKYYEVLKNEKLGRYLVASKRLDCGELIFTDKPFAVGPKPDSPPLCLGCYCPCDGTVWCPTCGWPCCGVECARAPHHALNECKEFFRARVKFQPVEDYTASCVQYECITPLRLLLEMERNPKRWKSELEDMETHTAVRQSRPTWVADQVNVARFLVQHCKLGDRFTEELVHKVCGILEVNSVEIPSRGGFSIRAIYPRLAVAAHSCVANIVHTILVDSDYTCHVRSAIKIKKGEMLKLCYTYALYPTMMRREYLKESKFFDCDCERCSDPTELNTHISTLKCNKCDDGIILSTNPLDDAAAWKCTHCSFCSSGSAIHKILAVVQSEIDEVDECEPGCAAIEKREQLIKKYRSVFHPKHAMLLTLKHSLAQLYGRVNGYSIDELPDILLERKTELCRQILEVLDVITPGESRMRAMIQYELHAPLMFMARNEFKCGLINAGKLKDRMKEPIRLLQSAASVLQREDPTSAEGIIGKVAQQSMVQLQESLNDL